MTSLIFVCRLPASVTPPLPTSAFRSAPMFLFACIHTHIYIYRDALKTAPLHTTRHTNKHVQRRRTHVGTHARGMKDSPGGQTAGTHGQHCGTEKLPHPLPQEALGFSRHVRDPVGQTLDAVQPHECQHLGQTHGRHGQEVHSALQELHHVQTSLIHTHTQADRCRWKQGMTVLILNEVKYLVDSSMHIFTASTSRMDRLHISLSYKE